MFQDFMNKVRYWDNQSAKWMMKHFYIFFFEIVLVLAFLAFFVNTIQVINIGADISRENHTENLLLTQSVNGLIIVFLFLMNSFWMLYMFNGITRIRATLRDISYQLNRRRGGDKSDNNF